MNILYTDVPTNKTLQHEIDSSEYFWVLTVIKVQCVLMFVLISRSLEPPAHPTSPIELIKLLYSLNCSNLLLIF